LLGYGPRDVREALRSIFGGPRRRSAHTATRPKAKAILVANVDLGARSGVVRDWSAR
jgi:hypothetical protein